MNFLWLHSDSPSLAAFLDLMCMGWISLKRSGYRSAVSFYSNRRRTRLQTLGGLVLGSVPLLQTRGPRASSRSLPAGGALATIFLSPAAEVPASVQEAPRQQSHSPPSGIWGGGHVLPSLSSRYLRPPAVLHSPAGGAPVAGPPSPCPRHLGCSPALALPSPGPGAPREAG